MRRYLSTRSVDTLFTPQSEVSPYQFLDCLVLFSHTQNSRVQAVLNRSSRSVARQSPTSVSILVFQALAPLFSWSCWSLVLFANGTSRLSETPRGKSTNTVLRRLSSRIDKILSRSLALLFSTSLTVYTPSPLQACRHTLGTGSTSLVALASDSPYPPAHRFGHKEAEGAQSIPKQK